MDLKPDRVPGARHLLRLAVTVQLKNAIVMSIAVLFVLVGSNITISLLRNLIPHRIRIIVELAVVASLVIIVDQVLQAFLFDMSKTLSVFVGLIITNCIILGRAEAFAMANGPWLSFWDAVGNAVGYGWVLCVVAAFREVLGSGRCSVSNSWATRRRAAACTPSATPTTASWCFHRRPSSSWG